MHTRDDLDVGRRAFQLFSVTYALTWADSFATAVYEREYGTEQTGHVLALISRTGCTFQQAADAIAAVEVA